MDISNVGSISYTYDGVSGRASIKSNENVLSLFAEDSVLVTKQPLSDSFIPGDNVGYQISITNTGSSPVYNLQLSDNLGEGSLTYVSGSATLIDGSELQRIIPTETTGTLQFSYPGILPVGQTVFFTYLARTTSSQSITNTITVTGNGGSSSGPVISETASTTVNPLSVANVSISKSASDKSLNVNEPFDYIFTLTNTGTINATNVVLTDTLEEKFTINTIVVQSGNTRTTYGTNDYTYTGGNLTLPSGSGPEITVPAGQVVTITINGQFTGMPE